MKTPKRLQALVDEGMIDEVLSQLMSGKEATVYVVRCGDQIRCAKMYKEAGQRSFKQAAAYQEGRTVKNSRQARAMQKGSKYGRKMQEAAQQLGFDAAQARQLALATFQGAAQLAQQSDESVSILRERVTSKGGTTYAALCSMDASAVKPAIHQAVLAAAQRGKELGDEFGQN